MGHDCTPRELRRPNGRPRGLRLVGVSSRDVASRAGATLRGPDLPILRPAFAGGLDDPDGCLIYVSSRSLLPKLDGLVGLTVITSADLADAVPQGNAVLVTDEAPAGVFSALVDELSASAQRERLRHDVHPLAKVAASAVLEGPVAIEAGAELGPGTVVHANTFIGEGSSIKANATLGGVGFQLARFSGSRRRVSHLGGAWLDANVSFGTSCIDVGLFGEFTYLGPETGVDNLVHVGHGCQMGRACTLTGGVILGAVSFGDGVWVGPQSNIVNVKSVGDYAFIGSGAVVVRDIPAHALVYGNPARLAGWVCSCRTKLPIVESETHAPVACPSCGLTWRVRASYDGLERHL